MQDSRRGSGTETTATFTIAPSRGAALLAETFTVPYDYERVRAGGFYDDAGFCGQCCQPYCARHWDISRSCYGHCPHGHGKSLDPHWWAGGPLCRGAPGTRRQPAVDGAAGSR